MRRFKCPLLILPLQVCLAACQGYEITVNERPVYTPPPLFTDFSLPDANLQACVDQHIKDQGITSAQQLQTLRCTFAGIQTIDGLALFTGLRQLDLSDNQLTEIGELARLSQLQVLNLANNQIGSAAPLLALVHLKRLSLTGNKGLVCKDLSQLADQQPLALDAPSQCQ